MTGSLERGGPPRRIPQPDERGVGLVEVVVATVIAVIAILALAYTFGTGRGLVNSYEAARVGLAAAQQRMEALGAAPDTSAELRLGPHPPSGAYPVQVDGRTVAFESWTVEGYDDPADGTGTLDWDLKRVTVKITWGRQSPHETVTLTRLFPFY